MAAPEDHDDLSLMGRLLETVKGAQSGLVSATRMIVSGGEHNEQVMKTKPPVKKLPVKELLEFDTRPRRRRTSSTTFIYEQTSVDGNQNGPLRAIGHAHQTN